MKLQDIQEAQYHATSCIPWVKRAMQIVRQPNAPYQETHVREPEVAMKQLTKEFGPPKFSHENGKYHVWRYGGEYEITLGMLTGQLSVQMDW